MLVQYGVATVLVTALSFNLHRSILLYARNVAYRCSLPSHITVFPFNFYIVAYC